MIPQVSYKETITVGNTQTEQASIELTPHMFDMLSSKVYTNKVLAVVREILCNARDAQVMAGIEKPIEVHLPSQLEPYFSIRDFGTGLSEEQVMKLYLRYGWSDKRDSNDVIGGLGIGSKSPLAYSDSFLVISYHEGTVNTYSIYKDQGIPQVSKLSSKPTEEPNGIMVKVTIKPQDKIEFTREVKNFVRFFDYPVLCDKIEYQKPEPYMDSEHYSMYNSKDVGHETGVKAVMGGVVYRVSSQYLDNLPFNMHNKLILLKFDIGQLSVAASRESLSEDKATVANIEKAVKAISAEYYKDIQDKLNSETTLYAAYDVLLQNSLVRTNWNGKTTVQKVGSNTLTWEKLPAEDHLVKLVAEKVNAINVGFGNTTGKLKEYMIMSIGENPTVLINDRRGAQKLASKLSNEHRRKGETSHVIVLDTDDDNGKSLIKRAFKEPNFIKVSEVYAEHFPKVESDKLKVAKSGLYDLHMNSILEVEEELEGFYMLFNRDELVTNEDIDREIVKLTRVRFLLNQLINDGIIDTKDVYICRKSGLSTVKKTKLKELTLKDLSALILKKYDVKVYGDYLLKHSISKGDITRYISYSDKMGKVVLGRVGKKMPLVAKMTENGDSLHNVRAESSINMFFDKYEDVLEQIVKEFGKLRIQLKAGIRKEMDLYRELFPLLTAFSSYGYNDSTMREDLEMYIDMKIKQAKV